MSKDGRAYKPDKVKMPPKKSVKKKVVKKRSIPKKTIPPREPPKEESPPEEPKRRKKQKRVTLQTHMEKFDELLELMDNEIKRKSREKEKGTRSVQKMRKLVRELKHETPKVANIKRKRATNGNRVGGFMKKYKINAEGAEFLQVPEGTLLSRRELTNAICVYAHYNPDDTREQMKRWEYLNPGGKRDLQKEGKRMIIEPDDVLSKLLRYDEYKQQVKEGKIMTSVTEKTPSGEKKTSKVVQKDDSLYYRVIQKLINHLFDRSE